MADIKKLVDGQRMFFSRGETLEVSFRRAALVKLLAALKGREKDILDALKKDLNKAPFESYMAEIGLIYTELNEAIRNLPRWNRIKRVGTPLYHFKASSYIISEPYGVVLVMSPWNYPFQLTLAPLIGAIAGGNCVVIKPSAYSPNTSEVIGNIIGSCFDEQYIAVVGGGREANQELLKEKFDYIFFTGSVSVGKMVMEAASKHLTPVTLELGGKSPCIVHKDANIDIAARRIVWGKFLNSGQTCVAPDYLLVHRKVKGQLLDSMKKVIREYYGESPCKNADYPRIINEKHFSRLKGLMNSGKIIAGGESNGETLQISPTILDQVQWTDPVMGEEIFGPLLPVLTFDELEEVITTVNSHPKPLALYLFTGSREVEKQIVKRISFGGGCINDILAHLANPGLPFGGVGESGMGGYHGKWSFDTFTHKKSILKKSAAVELKFRYPPYGDKLEMLKKIMK